MLRIAVTGSMGSGKTTVCSMIRELDVRVVSCDALIKSFQTPGNLLWSRIKERWGREYMTEKNEVDRGKLGAKLLDDADFRKDIEEMSHPLVLDKMLKILSGWESEGVRLAAAEVPLLYEAGWENRFDKVIATWAPRSVLVNRIIVKREVSGEAARRWLDVQLPQEEKIRRADYVLDTGETAEKTRERISQIIEQIKEEI